MAFQNPNTENNVRNIDNNPAKNEGWKSDAFLNLYIPTRQGGRRKIGSVGLKLNKPMDKQLLDYLADAGDEGLESLKSRLVLDFQRADGNNGDELDLG
jgi:hypothetical protein